MLDSTEKEEVMVDSTQELLNSIFKIIIDEVADEEKIKGWREFYAFFSSGVETFVSSALGNPKADGIVSLLMVRIIVASYLAAKLAQPEVDFQIFRFMYMNSLEHSFAKIKIAIGQYKRMSDAEREEFIKEYSYKKASG